jgi:hypothetical protein
VVSQRVRSRPNTGGSLDFIRQAIMALQHFAEITDDD